EPGLAVEQGLDHAPSERGDRPPPQAGQHGFDVVIAFAARHRPQPMFGQLHPVTGQPDAGAGRQQGLKTIEILRRHDGDCTTPTSASLEYRISPSKGFITY